MVADASEDLPDWSDNEIDNIAYYLFGLGSPTNMVVDPIRLMDPGMSVTVLDTYSKLNCSPL
ncbi:MAG: hypothetical protein AAF212_10820 [Verrucomicrobiota bacterium]